MTASQNVVGTLLGTLLGAQLGTPLGTLAGTPVGTTANVPIGIIAGNGSYPLLVAEGIKKLGSHTLFGVAHKRETSESFSQQVNQCLWVQVGQLGKILAFFKKNHVKKLVFAGGITRKQLPLHLDLTGILFLLKNKNKRDDALMKRLTLFFDGHGIEVLDGTQFVQDCLASKGVICGRALTPQEFHDVELGYSVAKALGAVDVGQSVIVHNGQVVAVEALEGTDALIQRAGEITGLRGKAITQNGLVLVKCAKPNQELRIDRPAIGEQSLRALSAAGGTVLAVESSTTMLLEAPKVIAAASETGITLYGV